MNRFAAITSPPAGSSSTASSRTQKAASISHPPTGSLITSMFDQQRSTQVDGHLGDYLMNQMIASITDSAGHALRRTMDAKKKYLDQKRIQLGLAAPPSNLLPASSSHHQGSSSDHDRPPEPLQADIDEAYRIRMDAAGFKVGWVLAERLAKDKPRFPRANQPNHGSLSSSSVTATTTTIMPDALEVIKFICKDVWTAMYNKQADNLRTNHRGIYVIQDHAYRPFLRISAPLGYDDEMDRFCRKMLAFPLAVIRGALMNLGIQCIVSAEIAIPQCTFQIRTASAPSTNNHTATTTATTNNPNHNNNDNSHTTTTTTASLNKPT